MTAYLLGSATQPSVGRIGLFRKSNRAMTQAEMTAQGLAGVAEVDRGASQTTPVAPSFVTDLGGYSILGGAAATAEFNQSIGGLTGMLKLTATADGRAIIRRANFYNWNRFTDKRFALAIQVYVPSASVGDIRIYHSTDTSSHLNSRRLLNLSVTSENMTDGDFFLVSGPGGSIHGPLITKDAVARLDGLVTPKRTNEDDFDICFAGMLTGDVVYVKFRVVAAGSTVDLQPSAIQLAPGQWLDTANGTHALIPEGARLAEPRTSGQLRSVHTWNSSADPQYVGGADQAVLPEDSRITQFSARATVAGEFDIGDESDPARYASGVTIGDGWTDVPMLAPFHDGANRKVVVTPSSSYTGELEMALGISLLG